MVEKNKTISVKATRDGDRLVLLVENCTGEMRKKVQKLLLGIFDLNDELEDSVPDVEPLKTPAPEMPDLEEGFEPISIAEIAKEVSRDDILNLIISVGDYKGYKIGEAIEKFGLKPVVDLVTLMKSFKDKDEQEAVLDFCKRKIADDLIERAEDEEYTRKKFEDFLQLYKPLINIQIEKVLDEHGYGTIADFMQWAQNFTQEEVYINMRDDLLNRVSKS